LFSPQLVDRYTCCRISSTVASLSVRLCLQHVDSDAERREVRRRQWRLVSVHPSCRSS